MLDPTLLPLPASLAEAQRKYDHLGDLSQEERSDWATKEEWKINLSTNTKQHERWAWQEFFKDRAAKKAQAKADKAARRVIANASRDNTQSYELLIGQSLLLGIGPTAQITLIEAIERGIVSGTLASLRHARTRDQSFPMPVAVKDTNQEFVYMAGQLAAWEAHRMVPWGSLMKPEKAALRLSQRRRRLLARWKR